MLKKRKPEKLSRKRQERDELIQSQSEAGEEEKEEEEEEEGGEGVEEEEDEKEEGGGDKMHLVEVIDKEVAESKDKVQSRQSEVLPMFVFFLIQSSTDILFVWQADEVVSVTLGPFEILEGTKKKVGRQISSKS